MKPPSLFRLSIAAVLLGAALVGMLTASPAAAHSTIQGPQSFIEQQHSPQAEESTSQRHWLSWLSNPTIVFLLLIAGGLLILIETAAPGGWIAGATGGALIALAAPGLITLPLNWLGLAAIAIGFGLIFWELQSPTHLGLAAVIGGLVIIAGGFFLFDSPSGADAFMPSARVNLIALFAIAGFFTILFAGLIYYSRKDSLIVSIPRTSRMVGELGEVRTKLDPTGTVHVDSELWYAESESGETIDSHEKIVVAYVEDGIKLLVVKHGKGYD